MRPRLADRLMLGLCSVGAGIVLTGLAAGAPSTIANPWTGKWSRPASEFGGSSAGVTTLSQKGSTVTGSYDWHGGGTISGTASGSTLVGNWSEAQGSGTFHLTLAADALSFSGTTEGTTGVFKGLNGSWTDTYIGTRPVQTTTRSATVSKIVGDVEFSTGKGQPFVKLTPGTVLKNGYFVSTGYESSVTLNFGHGKLTVFPLTQLRVDEYTDAGNIVKTQTHLAIGLVRVIEPHTAAIRSDFSVVTPTCNSSIRGSGMVVSTSKSGVTTVYTTSDVSYVKGLADKKAITLRNGYMTTVGVNHKATKPRKYAPAALKKVTG